MRSLVSENESLGISTEAPPEGHHSSDFKALPGEGTRVSGKMTDLFSFRLPAPFGKRMTVEGEGER